MSTWPVPLPAWYWAWQLWRDRGGIPAERPPKLPRSIPAWAWDRYRLHRGELEPVVTLGIYERACFFINPDSAGPTEVLPAAQRAGMTVALWNVGDHAHAAWDGWRRVTGVQPQRSWQRCDEPHAPIRIIGGSTANIESPEIVSGFCTPERAATIVKHEGAIITEDSTPHADWTLPRQLGLPVFIEMDPNVRAVREKGIAHLVEYGRLVTGCVIVPAFFITENAIWDGNQSTFRDYWAWLRKDWPSPNPIALYAAENVPDWSVVA